MLSWSVPGILVIYAASLYTAENRLKCVQSKGVCELPSHHCYNISVCPQQGVPVFCMAVIVGNQTVARDCFNGDSSMTYCNSSRCVPQPRGDVSICCCNTDFCNQLPSGPTADQAASPSTPHSAPLLVVKVACIGLVVALVPFVLTFLVVQRRLSRRPLLLLRDHGHLSQLAEGEGEEIPLYPRLEGDIELGDLIKSARGGFGRVHLGRYTRLDGSCIPVAIKVFDSQKKQSWLVERGFYTSRKMCRPHENLLQYYGARDEVVGCGGSSRGGGDPEEGLCDSTRIHHLWILTEYHRRGSLTQYLSQELLTWPQLYVMVEGLAAAVEYLHSFHDYPVAHRDIKSQNVLVKEDLTVCLADFGLSLAFDQPFAGKNLTQTGTLMYMAPEMLESAIDDFTTQNYLAVDVYAMGLVLWEMVSRCSALIGPVDQYRLPYEKELRGRITLDAMTHYVSVLDGRPVLQHHWMAHPVLGTLCETVACCWEREPEVRISAGTVLARLADLPPDDLSPPALEEGGQRGS